MRSRCADPDNKHYGAKGISVCPEWGDFAAFRAWALSAGYDDSLSIDRIDSDEGYSPENCEWVTPAENTRRANAHRWRAT